MQKKIIITTVLVYVLVACNNQTKTTKEIKHYTAEQLYNNENINGIAFNKDETKLLINSDQTGIQNLYLLNISDTAMQPLTHSVKESFYGIDYLP